MKPPCVVNFYLLSTEWSKNLFTIIIMDYKTADEKLPRNYALTNLKPYEYFEYLLTEIPKHMDDTDRSFLNALVPWSEKLPENIRKPKN